MLIIPEKNSKFFFRESIGVADGTSENIDELLTKGGKLYAATIGMNTNGQRSFALLQIIDLISTYSIVLARGWISTEPTFGDRLNVYFVDAKGFPIPSNIAQPAIRAKVMNSTGGTINLVLSGVKSD